MAETLEEKRAKTKLWKQQNKEKVKAYKKTWDEQNKAHKAAYKKEWDAKNAEKRKEADKRFKRNNPLYNVEKHLKGSYGISIEDYNFLLQQQQFKCQCCGIESEKAQRGKLFVDHCHNSGKIRGLLCQQCNTALGMVKDNVETLYKLATYLLNNKGEV